MNQENLAMAQAAGSGQAAHSKAGQPLRPSELADVCGALAAETDPAKQRLYWEVLEQSAPCSKALDLALNRIMNPAASNRGEAVRYLRFCYPDRLPALLDAFKRDPDEELRYQLSEFLRDSDVEAAVGMKMGMLRGASAERQEKLVHEVAELGNLNHLEALRGLDQLHGGNSVFAQAADLLAKRTKS